MNAFLQIAADTTSGVDAPNALHTLPPMLRIAVIALIAFGMHLIVRVLRWASEWVLSPVDGPGKAHEIFVRREPKVATLTTLVVSALTFTIYFIAFGLILSELGVTITTYFASTTVIALAVGFGSQGLVQDIVIGITLVFSDAFNVGDIVEISGQVGRVDRIGLRFTTLTNFLGQTVYIPNRNIGVIGRYRRGAIRAFVDIQLTRSVDETHIIDTVHAIARGLRAQQPAILLSDPEVLGPFDAAPGDWRFIRVKFRVWPGQGAFVEGAFRQRTLAALRQIDAEYADWMMTVSYRTAR
ncbi:MAG: mechanosensitive ion channel [Gemmatimonadetes bacterium]|nr:mechanosensitive ion channel [Gemmatimonadota bacterium]